jgi:SAM-dependent methyltransferase
MNRGRNPDVDCPLCGSTRIALRLRAASRSYLGCTRCTLIFVPPGERLSPEDELARYRLHRNDVYDPRYRQFLAPLAEAVLAVTAADTHGLDFGCGPGPALAHLLEAAGRRVTLYDPFFAPDERVWSRMYDFIVASEVFEYLHRPGFELDRLFGVLRPGGVLGIMTTFVPPREADFAAWHYLRDPTHVCFYSPTTFEHIAQHWNACAEFRAPNVVLLMRT